MRVHHLQNVQRALSFLTDQQKVGGKLDSHFFQLHKNHTTSVLIITR